MTGTILILMLSVTTWAAQPGTLSLSGNGCATEADSKSLKVLDAAKGRYKIPLHLQLNKTEGNQLERKTCNFSLPIKLSKNEKIKVVELVQSVKMNANKGTQSQLSLSVFAAGAAAKKPLIIESKGSNDSQIDEEFTSAEVFESKCGKDLILRGNLSAFARGDSKASASSGDLLFTIQSISCP